MTTSQIQLLRQNSFVFLVEDFSMNISAKHLSKYLQKIEKKGPLSFFLLYIYEPIFTFPIIVYGNFKFPWRQKHRSNSNKKKK